MQNQPSNTIFNKLQIVELPVTSTGSANTAGVFNFTPQFYLSNKQIISLEIYSPTDVTLSPQGFPLVDSAIMSNCFLNLYYTDKNGGEGIWVNNLPLWDLHRIINGVDPYVRDVFGFNRFMLQWEKCFINCSTIGGIGLTQTKSFLLQVGYLDCQ